MIAIKTGTAEDTIGVIGDGATGTTGAGTIGMIGGGAAITLLTAMASVFISETLRIITTTTPQLTHITRPRTRQRQRIRRRTHIRTDALLRRDRSGTTMIVVLAASLVNARVSAPVALANARVANDMR